MSKTRRGPWAKANKGWRGTCPLCNRPRVKLLWEKNKVKICKICASKAN